jgi:hypothetical protein
MYFRGVYASISMVEQYVSEKQMSSRTCFLLSLLLNPVSPKWRQTFTRQHGVTSRKSVTSLLSHQCENFISNLKDVSGTLHNAFCLGIRSFKSETYFGNILHSCNIPSNILANAWISQGYFCQRLWI